MLPCDGLVGCRLADLRPAGIVLSDGRVVFKTDEARPLTMIVRITLPLSCWLALFLRPGLS